MTDLANEVLANLVHDPARGALLYRGVRYLLIRPETLADWYQAVETELGPESAAACALAGGRTGGLLSSRKFREALGLDARGAAEFMCRMGGQIGWGAMTLVEFDEGAGRLVVEVEDSPFAGKGLCHLIRGVYSGLAEGLFGGAIRAEEVTCRGRGAGRCRFEVESSRALEPS